jgi:myo-inositol 2-dehydrogenase/D-chiro-inositol 1-dehydrogenase
LVQYYAGPVEWVCAQPSTAGKERFGYAAVLRFASGATGLVELSNYESRGVPHEHIHLMGDGRSIVVENVTQLTYQRNAAGMARGRALDQESDSITWVPNMSAISPENWSLAHQGYLEEVRNFADAVLTGAPPRPDISDGIAAIRLAHAIHESNGRPVVLAKC